MIHSQKPVQVQQLVSSIARKLCDKYCDKALCQQYAWWVLEAIMQTKKSDLLLQHEISLTDDQMHTLHTWIEQQIKEHVPLQYLIGSVPFADCELIVEPPIPLPRPETEEWISRFIAQVKEKNIQPASILDLGTGSGCIAIALAKAFPHTEIYASDISKQSLALAEKNAARNNVEIQFVHADLFDDFPADMQFDIIISNPPYISPQEWKKVDASVRNWEDSGAHVASDNGMSMLKQIISQAANYLAPNAQFNDPSIPNLLVEIGHNQAPEVKKLFQESRYQHILVQQDLYGNDRLVSGYIDACEKKE